MPWKKIPLPTQFLERVKRHFSVPKNNGQNWKQLLEKPVAKYSLNMYLLNEFVGQDRLQAGSN